MQNCIKDVHVAKEQELPRVSSIAAACWARPQHCGTFSVLSPWDQASWHHVSGPAIVTGSYYDMRTRIAQYVSRLIRPKSFFGHMWCYRTREQCAIAGMQVARR